MSKPELVGMVILIGLISYNFKLSLSVKRLRNQIGKARLNELYQDKSQQLLDVIHEKRKWTILSQILIFASFVIALMGVKLVVLLYFLILYTVTTIYINRLTQHVFKSYTQH
ncbi:MAG: hypothetical protein ABF804_10530 [Liquorilactobacillus ghanensis]|jgi:uncharacterized membrane protein YhaH (DUF805 family)|uniref:Uncharacterized protein n=1 Tax=Liquorilactobacillus ghanensis DSM 18630 TaxID=1423750 RepID=A0A0R1VG50_9LACO|nr:hypothetical protein [Liquorilactobacillus ghanensis]KRM04401.1 hypothetical protein FC89_GL002345 [Liquorilactobacillus ghanensis DSM 18630]